MLPTVSISGPASISGLGSISGIAGDGLSVVVGLLIFGLLVVLLEGIDRI